MEIVYLCGTLFFFQIGFVLRILLVEQMREKIDNNEQTGWWTDKYRFWFNIMPLFYETLPILVVYLHHIKNFRLSSRVPSNEQVRPERDTTSTTKETNTESLEQLRTTHSQVDLQQL